MKRFGCQTLMAQVRESMKGSEIQHKMAAVLCNQVTVSSRRCVVVETLVSCVFCIAASKPVTSHKICLGVHQ